MKLFRVENLIDQKGLWYNSKDGSESNLVHDLKLSNFALPMDYDPKIAQHKWKSAAESVDQLRYWFTHEDLQKLIPLGYNLYEIEVDDITYQSYEDPGTGVLVYKHPLFQEIKVIDRIIRDINILL